MLPVPAQPPSMSLKETVEFPGTFSAMGPGVLPQITQLVMAAVAPERLPIMPPDSTAELPRNVQLVSDTLPPLLKTAPP